MALFRKALVLGGAAVAAVAFLKRDRVAGLLPSRAGTPQPAAPPPPAPANAGGQEQAEAALVEDAVVRDEGMTDAERQLEDAMEQQYSPLAGETVEPVVSEQPPGAETAEHVPEGPLSVGSPIVSADGEHDDEAEHAEPAAAAGGPQPRAYSASHPPEAPTPGAAVAEDEHEAAEAGPRAYSAPHPPQHVEPSAEPAHEDDEPAPALPDASSFAPAPDAPATEQAKEPTEPSAYFPPDEAEHDDDEAEHDEPATAGAEGPQPRSYSASHPPEAPTPGASAGEEHEPSTFHERTSDHDEPEPRTYSASEPPAYVEPHEPTDEEHEALHEPEVATYSPPSPHAYDAPPTEPVGAAAGEKAAATAAPAADEPAPPVPEPAGAELAAAGDEPAGIAPGEALLEPEEAAEATPDQDATGAEPEDAWKTWTGPKVQPPPPE